MKIKSQSPVTTLLSFRKFPRSLAIGCIAVASVILGGFESQGALFYWSSKAKSGDWFDAANWVNSDGSPASDAPGENDQPYFNTVSTHQKITINADVSMFNLYLTAVAGDYTFAGSGAFLAPTTLPDALANASPGVMTIDNPIKITGVTGSAGIYSDNQGSGYIQVNGKITPANDEAVTLGLGGRSLSKSNVVNGMIGDGMAGAGGMSVAKDGAGYWALNGANTYTGATTVLAGTLALSASGSIGASPLIDIKDGATLDTTAQRFVMPVSQLLRFTLNANGAAGKLRAGDLNISKGAVDFAVIGALSADYVIASYTQLTGTQFDSVKNLPAGYAIDYHYNDSNVIALTPVSSKKNENKVELIPVNK